MTSPPSSRSGDDSGSTTSWPDVSTTDSHSSPSERPVTVSASPSTNPPSIRRFVSNAMPPALCSSTAAKRPPGFKSHSSGVRRLMRSMSSMFRSTPTVRAIASRCSTALVEPPLAATAAIALSNARRVRICDGRMSCSKTCSASRPAASAAVTLPGSTCGIELKPTGDRPITSITIDIVLAVYWPPQAPAPGHATCSISARSASLALPATTSPSIS